MSRWIQTHKLTFLTIALSMMTLSFFSAVHEMKKKNNRTGLVVFGLAMAATLFLLGYNKVKYGFFI